MDSLARVLLPVALLQQLLLVAVSVPAWRTSTSSSAVRGLVLGILTTFIGVAVFVQRGTLPNVVAIVVANGMLLSGQWTTFRYARAIVGFPTPPRRGALAVAGAFAVFAAIWAVDDSAGQTALARYRFAIQSAAMMAVTAAWARDLWRHAARPWSLGTRYLVTAASGMFVMQAIRAIAFMVGPTTTDPLRNPIMPLVVGWFMVSSLLTSLGIILEIEAQARNRLRGANEQLTRDAITDELTGIANRRGFEQAGRRELQRAERYRWPLTVMLVDVDHFKRVNDRFGHLAGDAVLREIAARCQQELRTHDLLARWGGEEFAVLLPQCDLAAAQVVAARVLAAVRAHPIAAIDGAAVTVSIGIAAVGSADGALVRAIEHADTALYQAKRAGRDRSATATIDVDVSSAPGVAAPG